MFAVRRGPCAQLVLLALLALAGVTSGCASDAPTDGDEVVADSDDLGQQADALTANENGVLDAEEAAFLSDINGYRAGLGLPKLHVSFALTAASTAHSVDMAAHEKLQHESSDGTDSFTRIKKYYPHGTLGEIVADGYTTASAVLAGWKASPQHDEIMRGSQYRVIGIARVPAANGVMYWTCDFGATVDAVLSTGFGSIAANGSFEHNAFGKAGSTRFHTRNKWFLHAGAGGSVKRVADPTAGAFALRLRDVEAGSASAAEIVRGSAGVSYRLTTMARRLSGAGLQHIHLDFLDAKFKRIRVVIAPSGTSPSYAPIAAEAVAPAGTRYVRIALYANAFAGQASTYDYDDVRLAAF